MSPPLASIPVLRFGGVLLLAAAPAFAQAPDDAWSFFGPTSLRPEPLVISVENVAPVSTHYAEIIISVRNNAPLSTRYAEIIVAVKNDAFVAFDVGYSEFGPVGVQNDATDKDS